MPTKYQRRCRKERREQRRIDIADWRDHLAELGFASYVAYLASELWTEIRRRVFERDHGKCVGCGKPARKAHHRDYGREAMTGEKIDMIVSLCGFCHRRVEFARDGHKRTPYAADIVLRDLMRKMARRSRG